MVEFAPSSFFIVNFRPEKDMQVSFRKIMRLRDARTTRVCPSVCILGAFCFSVPAKKAFRRCVYAVVCKNMYNFKFIQVFIFACAQQCGWTRNMWYQACGRS